MPTIASREWALRRCARWHERQVKRNPERAAHHERTARSLRAQADAFVRQRTCEIALTGLSFEFIDAMLTQQGA